ncbi:tetratricopeptide repeat protein [Limnospira sp. PMC 1223.20]|uniref:tetratricopeptide repeat protein n=1 Tax=Limnospira sp. PMC 1223.20 TaxID=2981021 RepID=UPI0028E11D32|nr:tetratricopeptide repeat protein [Limnospira sp. PMC 1223.20]MDT9266490.1 tetratricopeptide repeat protein [Limnospira sp. PMC 1223.20]
MSAGELFKQANQLKRSGRLDEAIALYHQVIDINPHFTWAYYNLGDSRAREGDLEKALTYYEKALTLNPNSIFFNAAKAKIIYQMLCLDYGVFLPYHKCEEKLFQEIDVRREFLWTYNKVFQKKPQLLHPNLTEDKVSQFQNNFIVAGIPRSGTTMIFRVLAGLPPGNTTPRHYFSSVKKTHALAPQKLPKEYKVIFIFGDVINSIISTKSSRYDKFHFLNCGCTKDPENTDIYLEDALNYTAMFESWNQDNGYPVISVRYEAIYNNVDRISEFLGINLILPPFKPRSTKHSDCSDDQLQNIKTTYQNLIDKVQNAPDIAYYH